MGSLRLNLGTTTKQVSVGQVNVHEAVDEASHRTTTFANSWWQQGTPEGTELFQDVSTRV